MRVGITVEVRRGQRKTPALTAANEAARQMVTFGSLLGLDPASRQRLITPKQGAIIHLKTYDTKKIT
ncbi:P27 family phage terminase small subunit [Escherichia coli]|nr:P27 family phage terminase small subunit [Escherichia coli]